MHAHHRELHHVRRRALNGHIERDALAERAGGKVARRQLGEIAAAVHERFNVALRLRLFHDLGHVAAHAGEAVEVILNILLRLVNAHADVLRERKRGDTVDDAEVDRLRVRAHLLRHRLRRHAEHLRGGDGVDILAAQKRLPHRLVARDVGEQPQLDLAVVRVHEHIAALGHEHPPQLAAERRARRDILQIRLGGAEPPRGGHGHLEARAHAPVRPDDLQQSVAISRFQLGVLTVLQHVGDNGVLPAQLFKHIRVRRPAGLRLFAVRQAETVEKHLAELLGGVDVEAPVGLLVNALLQRFQLRVHRRAEVRERLRVHAHARKLHLREHAAER